MKKVVCFFVFLYSFLMMVSCSQTNEDKVIAAFKEYAEKNLDNPSAISEIIGIDSVITFSTIQIKEDITKIYCLYDSTHILAKNAGDAFVNFTNDPNKTSKINKVELNKNPKFKSLMFNFMSLSEKQMNLAKESSRYAAKGDSINVYLMENEYKGIMNKKDTIFCGMKLSYRTKVDNDVKLHKIDVICDTLYSSFHFAKDVPQEYSVLMNDFHYFTEKYKRDFEIDLEIRNTLLSLDSLIKELYNVGFEMDE